MEASTTDFTSAEIARGEALFKGPCTFVKGVVRIDDLPTDGKAEIAFTCNPNTPTWRNGTPKRSPPAARVSVTPGRTRELNFFTLGRDHPIYLVDMPGYGYARAPKSAVKGWTRLIRDYLKGRRELKRVFVLIDARHGIKPNDKEYKDGPNFDQRKEEKDQILYAIRNGGFSSGPMPQNILVGQQAEKVADFIAKYSGTKRKTPPQP